MPDQVTNCRSCQRQLMTHRFRYAALEGYILVIRIKTYDAWLCRVCAGKLFRKVQFDTFARGWWSLACLITNPFIMVGNLVQYRWGIRTLPKEQQSYTGITDTKETKERPKFCTACGCSLLGDAAFCTRCGKTIAWQ